MKESSVMVPLPQMVDLALNCPEVGAVNFNILHSLLHVIIQQVDLLECKVEFKGNDSERVQHLIAKGVQGPTLNLTEYIITPGKEQRRVISKQARYSTVSTGTEPKSSKEEVLVERELQIINQRKDSRGDPDFHPSKLEAIDKGIDSMETVVVVETTDAAVTANAAHVSVALTRVHFDNIEDELEKLKQEVHELKELPTNIGLIEAIRNSSASNATPVLDMFQILTLTKRADATEEGLAKLASMIEDLVREQATGSSLQEIKEMLNKRLQAVEQAVEGEGANLQEMINRGNETKCEAADSRITDLEAKFKEYTEHITTMDDTFNDQVDLLQQHLTDLEKEIGEIVERINSVLPSGDTGGSEQGCQELYNKMVTMQEEIEKLTETASNLLNEKDDRQTHMDALLEQIELLKTIKADREDLQDALADKADTCAVNRKVSHAQFDAACDDLSRSIEDALKELKQQEHLWQQALEDIQSEIENKLDKMELTPLRDFIHNKLKMLQERLKALAALKEDTEAAGTKSKFLRNVNCISCDKDVVMRKEMDPTLMPPPPALPPTQSMGPYLAYELDQMRKQKKCMPHSRNMNHFENAQNVGKMENDHICNRYCGGSHTTTTPQQRVARLGHFLQQWDPESQNVKEADIRGTDGQMYKSRNGDQVKTTREPSMTFKPPIIVTGDILSARHSKVSGRASITTSNRQSSEARSKHSSKPKQSP